VLRDIVLIDFPKILELSISINKVLNVELVVITIGVFTNSQKETDWGELNRLWRRKFLFGYK
jgi:hypothetical protein